MYVCLTNLMILSFRSHGLPVWLRVRDIHCSCVCVFVQVTHKTTGQVMVMKEIVRCTDESKSGFLKEVCTTNV